MADMTPQQQAQIARINRESEQLFGKGASKEKFAWRQAQRERAGLGREKRKRGGLSGVWDRNKQVIKPIAAGVAGALTGGAALPMLLGAAMEGFDRPGKSGFGFDVGRGLRGAGTGALAGAAGAAIGGAANLTPALGGAATKTAAGNVGGGMAGAKGALGNYFFGAAKPAPTTTPTPAPSAPTGAPPAPTPPPTTPPTTLRDLPGAALRFAQNNPNAIAGLMQGAGAAIGAGAERDAALASMDFERERWEQEQESRRRIAELLAPLLSQEMQSRRGLPMPQIPTEWNQRPAWL